jgi:hypothetical protein
MVNRKEETMRRILLSIGAAVALAAAALPTTASAQRHHFGGPHFGFRGPGFAFGLGVPGPYYDYGYDYGDAPSCYRVEREYTRWGVRVHRIWVC